MTSERVSHLGSRAFAPVGRGTADHPDRDRQRDEHTADRRPDRQTRLHGQPRDQTRHMVPVQRERILPAVPARPRPPAGVGHRTAAQGLVAAAGQRPAEAGAPRRRIDAPLPGDHIPVGLRRQGAPRTLDTLSAEGPSPQAQGEGPGRGQEPHTAQDIHPREALRTIRVFRQVGVSCWGW